MLCDTHALDKYLYSIDPYSHMEGPDILIGPSHGIYLLKGSKSLTYFFMYNIAYLYFASH